MTETNWNMQVELHPTVATFARGAGQPILGIYRFGCTDAVQKTSQTSGNAYVQLILSVLDGTDPTSVGGSARLNLTNPALAKATNKNGRVRTQQENAEFAESKIKEVLVKGGIYLQAQVDGHAGAINLSRELFVGKAVFYGIYEPWDDNNSNARLVLLTEEEYAACLAGVEAVGRLEGGLQVAKYRLQNVAAAPPAVPVPVQAGIPAGVTAGMPAVASLPQPGPLLAGAPVMVPPTVAAAPTIAPIAAAPAIAPVTPPNGIGAATPAPATIADLNAMA